MSESTYSFPRVVYVISDLHLGGSPQLKLCRLPGLKLLAKFIRWITTQHPPGPDQRPAHLVLNGDIFDFLAELSDREEHEFSEAVRLSNWRNIRPDFGRFDDIEREALAKMRRMLGIDNLGDHHAELADIIAALGEFIGQGGTLTMLVGNHDIELCFPSVRKILLDAIMAKSGRQARLGEPPLIELRSAHQGVKIGSAYIVHGNEVDCLNRINTEELNNYIAFNKTAFSVPLGSRFVKNYLNLKKVILPFLDAIQPQSAAIAITWATALSYFSAINETMGLVRRLTRAAPSRPATSSASNAATPSEALTASALAPASGTDLDEFQAYLGELQSNPAETSLKEYAPIATITPQNLRSLWKFLIKKRDAIHCAMSTHSEEAVYIDYAQKLARENKSQVVVLGHTHLPKFIKLDGVGAYYLNTGTWIDLCPLDERILSTTFEEAEVPLRELIRVLSNGSDTERSQYLHLCPTYARIELDTTGSCDDPALCSFIPDRKDGFAN